MQKRKKNESNCTTIENHQITKVDRKWKETSLQEILPENN